MTKTAAEGLIALEEHCVPPGLLAERQRALGRIYPTDLAARLTDFTDRRLKEMDACGIEVAVLSIANPGVQVELDPANAAVVARRMNDMLAEEIAKRPDRFFGFATLAMHHVDEACAEFERAVHDLGMRGALFHNFQRTATEGGDALFYDDRRFDAFWATAERLDVPVYLHPGSPAYHYPALPPAAARREEDFCGFDWLKDAAWNFAAQTGLHALRIITSGVFDRFPKAQLILGHNGEHIVYDLWRIDNTLKRRPMGLPAKSSVRAYFRSNVYVTTSGNFSTPGLEHVIKEIGHDRIMFSVDYPYEDNYAAADWFSSLEIEDEVRAAIGRNNAAALLKISP